MISEKLPLTVMTYFQAHLWKILFWVLAALLLVLMPLMSRHYVIIWDEWMDSNNAMLTLRNILSGGKDMEFMNFWHGYLYPQVFYTIVGTTFGLFFDSVWNMAHDGLHRDAIMIPFYQYSHVVNSLFGYGAMLCTGLLTKKLAGWRAAFLALLFMALSPRFFGNSMNNPKDIPFAATYILSLYFMSSFLDRLPSISKKNFLLTSLGIGLCLGSRLGGIILMTYLGFVSLVSLIFLSPIKVSQKDFIRVGLALVGVTVLSLAIGFIFWPFGRTHTPVAAFHEIMKLTKFTFWDHGVLFDGTLTTASKLPWYYITKWILMSSPLFFPIGLVLWACSPQIKKLLVNRSILLLVLAGFFPILFIIVRHSIVYDSWRHVLFVYPPLVILCALGWEHGFQAQTNKFKKWAAVFFLVLACLDPLGWMVRNPIYASVYFNPLVGGIKGASSQYETDYWGNCMAESAKWLADYHLKNYGNFPYALVNNDGHVMQTYPFLKKKLGKNYQPFGYPADFLQTHPYGQLPTGKTLQNNLPWNYGIFMSRGLTSAQLKKNWPPEGTIHKVSADGVALCAVVRNNRFYEEIEKARAQSPKASAA